MSYNKDPNRGRDPSDRKKKGGAKKIPPPKMYGGDKKSSKRSTPEPRKEKLVIPSPPKPMAGEEKVLKPIVPPLKESSKGRSGKDIAQPNIERGQKNNDIFTGAEAGDVVKKNVPLIVALVLSILGLVGSCGCGGYFFGIPALICANVAGKDENRDSWTSAQVTQLKLARGLSITALIISTLVVIFSMLSN